MSCFIVDYRKFAPIIEGLEACGLSVPENGREPTDEERLAREPTRLGPW